MIGFGVGNLGKVGVGYFTSDSATLGKTPVRQIRHNNAGKSLTSDNPRLIIDEDSSFKEANDITWMLLPSLQLTIHREKRA